MVDLPRFTGSLKPATLEWNSPIVQIKLREELQQKRKLVKITNGLTWKELKCAHNQNNSKKSQLLKELFECAKDMVGRDTTQEALEESSAFLFEALKDTSSISSLESLKLQQVFGPFPATLATKAFECVQQLSYIISKKSDESSGTDQLNSNYFGHNIKLDFDFSDTNFENLYEEYEIESRTSVSSGDSFVQHFRDTLLLHQNVDLEKQVCQNNLSSSWLQDQCDVYVKTNPGSICSSDLASAIYDILATSKSNDEIQNELFDLVGFDAFDLILNLLEKRKEIIDAGSVKKSGINNVTEFQYIDPVHKLRKPLLGSQVTIHSELEKDFVKKMHKEERKLLRKDPELYKEIYNQNCNELQNIQSQPLFKRDTTTSSQQYPFVFDEFAIKKHTSSFVGGSKILLPESATKSSNKKYEEIDIPASATKLPDYLNIFVEIKNLDEVGQIVFRNIKKLNRIQSIVFDAAYNTNENLLVSAPTGAGKTNIALLAVTHEIKQNMEMGVVKKDAFKIVYVAPMKALASEMTETFGKRLQPLGIVVRELTGDMQLTKKEIQETQMLVTTPEKWDVVTRKGFSDVALSQIVRLLIIDEVHLLHDDRGAVLEALVARTLRQVESTQSMIRIVGLSATLPNYTDVAKFLNVNPLKGLFYFDGRFRPVPLRQTFIGIHATGFLQFTKDLNEVCYKKVHENVRNGKQVMVFVHARNATVKTAMTLREMAKNEGEIADFEPDKNAQYSIMEKKVMRSRNKQLKEMFPDGFGIHHAGMLRQDRNTVEELFSKGFIKVLVCTATLAWGVNLPAHAVIIKGTEIYDAQKGSFVDIGILDVLQIFGRAGRPQYDSSGHGIIISKYDKLSHYLQLLTQQTPIESQFVNSLTDNLNAEVSLGTVTTVDEAVKWLSYTYMYVRMRINPLVYGINYREKEEDPLLEKHRLDLIKISARKLDKAKMIRFDERTNFLYPTNLGRTASNYYIDFPTIEVINELFKPVMDVGEIFSVVSKAHEFNQIKVREDEVIELEEHLNESCVTPVKGGTDTEYGKVNILLQTYVSKAQLESFSLISDMSYVAQNATRIVRALFEISLQNNWAIMAKRLLTLSKVVEKQLWEWEHPFKQLEGIKFELLVKLEQKKLTVDMMREMDAKEIGLIVNHVSMGSTLKSCAFQIPRVQLGASIHPITRTVLRLNLKVIPDFEWNDKYHGKVAEPWWIWVEDPDTDNIYHSEYFLLSRKSVKQKEEQSLVFTIPIFEPLPPQYYVRAVSDRWLHSEAVVAISFKHLILPDLHPPHTELLDLQPLPVTVLRNSQLEMLYSFSHFNPIQTQLFHTLYYTDSSVLLGAPTGSGKTIAAELALFRVFREYPKAKSVYIAPLKALVSERMADWKVRIEQKLKKKVIELTGDVTPDIRSIGIADVIVTTPEKWDGISRSWQTRQYVKDVALIIIDEIHLLGGDRGPVLEVIVSRTNFISSHTSKKCRVIGLSTALANAKDLADWLGIGQEGLFNFRPSVRPVPLEVHIAGYPGKHYCPRMATMNKPCFKAIQTHSPEKPVLIFVSSRRQTRLTALDLIAFLAGVSNPKQWMKMLEQEMNDLISTVHDQTLKLTLSFGIGLHHAGLHERDRKMTEELFVNQKIQVLIATSTLAWGVNFPAHFVIIKGTEYYDGKTKRYVDFPITDVLQMMGRAGRPQYDDHGVALILVQDIKKNFYKRFLYEPFPVESNLLEVLPDHLNAEIVASTITSKQDAMDYMTWTYLFRRILMNPTYYGLDDTNHNSINAFLSKNIEKSIYELQSSYCVEVKEDDNTIEPTILGRISSYYYLSHLSMRMFKSRLCSELSFEDVLQVLCDAQEYDQLPVRHNEDKLNGELAELVPLQVNKYTLDSPHTKTHLLLQAHFSRVELPIADYITDTKSVHDQSIRILQAMIDVCADEGYLVTVLQIIILMQMTVQGCWYHGSSLLMLPNVTSDMLPLFKINPRMKSDTPCQIVCIPELISYCAKSPKLLHNMIGHVLKSNEIEKIYEVLSVLPIVSIKTSLFDDQSKGEQAIDLAQTNSKKREWLPIRAGCEYALKISIKRDQLSPKRPTSKAYAPLFSKSKDEGWFFLLGEIDCKDILALKRVSFIHKESTVNLGFYAPEDRGNKIFTLYLMSDSYLGMDQQYDLFFDVQ
ncbi:activating signal cointegrator 1 complex subunit 3 isoform X2 [Hydra vulgaris]|uniref:U5 small nuclear ribonucleoprotein 200 kDa helicase n=1 Tax=Hydra vulgaris TaxID=6087 RepID=A0ABM4BTA8_HYDVU